MFAHGCLYSLLVSGVEVGAEEFEFVVAGDVALAGRKPTSEPTYRVQNRLYSFKWTLLWTDSQAFSRCQACLKSGKLTAGCRL